MWGRQTYYIAYTRQDYNCSSGMDRGEWMDTGRQDEDAVNPYIVHVAVNLISPALRNSSPT